MNNFKIPHNALVFVGDGRRALFLRNDGDAISPSLRIEKVFEEENPPTHEQGRPGQQPGIPGASIAAGRPNVVEPARVTPAGGVSPKDPRLGTP